MKNNNKGAVNIILVVLIAVAVVGVGYFAFKKSGTPTPKIEQPQNQQPITNTTNQPVAVNDETANWQTYRNEKYGFEIKYPKAVTYVGINQGGSIWENGIKDGVPAGVAFKETSDFSKSFEVFPGAFPVFGGGLAPISLGVTILNVPSDFTTLENYAVKIKASRESQGQGVAGTNNQAKVIQIGSEKAIEVTQSDFSVNLNTSKDIVLKKGDYLYVFNYSFSQNAITGLRDEMTGQYFFAKDGRYIFEKINYDIIQKIFSTLKLTQ